LPGAVRAVHPITERVAPLIGRARGQLARTVVAETWEIARTVFDAIPQTGADPGTDSRADGRQRGNTRAAGNAGSPTEIRARRWELRRPTRCAGAVAAGRKLTRAVADVGPVRGQLRRPADVGSIALARTADVRPIGGELRRTIADVGTAAARIESWTIGRQLSRSVAAGWAEGWRSAAGRQIAGTGAARWSGASARRPSAAGRASTARGACTASCGPGATGRSRTAASACSSSAATCSTATTSPTAAATGEYFRPGPEQHQRRTDQY
jgi:hypothetical protein